MKKLLQIVLMSVMALFVSQTLLAQEVEKVSAVSAEVSVQPYQANTADKIRLFFFLTSIPPLHLNF